MHRFSLTYKVQSEKIEPQNFVPSQPKGTKWKKFACTTSCYLTISWSIVKNFFTSCKSIHTSVARVRSGFLAVASRAVMLTAGKLR